jgi:DNA-nicking Smr family endonuclease
VKKSSGQVPSKASRHLGEEDVALWDSLARTFEPLRRAKPRVGPTGAETDAPTAPQPLTPPRPDLKPVTRVLDQRSAAAKEPLRPPSPVATRAPPLAAFERRHARRLRSGQVEIEARLDLHGLHQADAHAALRRFLLGCHARGVRWALVITGKGAPGGVRPSSEHERGVLRRNVPCWLAEPELRAIVVSYTPAASAHGGEGALYVQLRRRRGETP